MEEKSNEIPLVVASERGSGQTKGSNAFGVRSNVYISLKFNIMVWESQPKNVKVVCVKNFNIVCCFQSTAGHVESGGNMGGPSSKPKYYSVTDSEEVL